MSDDTPADGVPGGTGGDYHEWPHTAPPGVGPRPRPEPAAGPAYRPDAVQRGVHAAAKLFGATSLVYVLAAVAAVLDRGNRGSPQLFSGLVVIVGGFVAAVVITLRLPLDSRAPFWTAGFAFMALSAMLWAATCSLAA